MPTLIDRFGLREDVWLDLSRGGDAAVRPDDFSGEDCLLLSVAQWRAERDAWTAGCARIGVVLGPADDPADLSDDLLALSLIAIEFPAFTDGRGYSNARLLRERHGWTGELRAVGEVLRDQLHALARCGFDTFALADGTSIPAALEAFTDFSEAYQGGIDRGPLFSRRGAVDAATSSVATPKGGARS